MPDDPQAIADLVEEINQKEDRRAGKRKRAMADDDLPRSGFDEKPQTEEVQLTEASETEPPPQK